MYPIEWTEVRVTDKRTGVTFKVYPEGELAIVSMPLEWDGDNISITARFKNNTDHELSCDYYVHLIYPREKDIIIGRTTIYPDTVVKIVNDSVFSSEYDHDLKVDIYRGYNLICRCEVYPTDQFEEKHIIEFSIKGGCFLWLESSHPCKVELKPRLGNLLLQRPEESLYIFDYATIIKLYATPPFCHVFQKWTIDNEEFYQNPVEYYIQHNVTATVYFESTI